MVLISVILPTYNEADNIKAIIRSIRRVFRESGKPGEIVIVDDNSPDGTGDLADELSKENSNVIVVHRKTKSGIGSAYLAGAEKSSGEILITMDSDFSHDPKMIPFLVQSVLQGADIAIGSRYIPGGAIENWGIYRKLVSKTANLFARTFLGLKTHDVTTGYRAYRRHVFNNICSGIKSSGYSFSMECVFLAETKGYKITEIPIVFVDRKMGNSKLGFEEKLKFAFTVVRLAVKRIL